MSVPGVVRRMRPDEAEAVGAITAQAYLHDGLLDQDHAYVRELADAARRDAGAEVWVCERDGLVLGTVTYCPPGAAYREVGKPDEGEFRMLAVAPAGRGLGVGTALVRHCVQRSRESGLSAVVLCTTAQMASAQRVYVALGFVRDPALDWSPVDGICLLGYRLRL